MQGLEQVFTPGARVFLPGSSGESLGVIAGLYAQPELTRDVQLTTTFVPGLNRLDVDRLHPTVRVSGQFMQGSLSTPHAEGRFRWLPSSYAGFMTDIAAGPEFDVCVLQVAPADAEGRHSLGPAVEFAHAVRARSRRLIAVVNSDLPRLPHTAALPTDAFDLVLEGGGAPRGYDPGAPEAVATRIAERVAAFVEDGALLQIGLGKTPAALCGLLGDRKGLRFHSGLLSDGALDLAESGALDADWRHKGCVFAGTQAGFARAADCDLIHIVGCEETHALSVLARLDRFIAVNSALEVDLFGQANLELAGGRAVSGAGGAPDFARAARQSVGGLSIVALPASMGAGDAARSRIVAGLSGGLASLARTDIDLVVTEHGVADLRQTSLHERAERIIAIADPQFQPELTDRWRLLAANF